MSERADQLRHLVETEGPNVSTMTELSNFRRYQAYDDLEDLDALRSAARAIKENAIERLPELEQRVTEAVEANGGSVHRAADAAEAREQLREIVADTGGETVVKSKSMTTEEIDCNEALESDGIDVYETDLGEFVLQVAEDTPSHIVGPAMHLSRSEIAELFTEHFEPEEPFEGADELTAFARDYLGEQIQAADVGITGANFVLADSGTIVLVTNEGNARKCAVTPDVHVAVAGIEKLIPSVAELEPFVQLIAKSATGQEITQYVSMLTPPTDSPTVDFDAPTEPIGSTDSSRAFHLVLLDNGRSAMRDDDQLRETLYCIRCGACSNVCSNFQQVGGHGFGGETYSGGIGTGWEAGVHGLESAADPAELCTGCTRCVDACPVEIDIPWINTVVQDRINRSAEPDRFSFLVDGLRPDESASGGLDRRLVARFDQLVRLASATAPVSNRLAESDLVRRGLERFAGIDRRQPLPTVASESLVAWFDRRGGSRVDPAEADRLAVIYPDVFSAYVDTGRGKAAVRTLESQGVSVAVPELPETGRAALSQGMVATAERRAQALASELEEPVAAGADIVVLEPSDHAMVTREYHRLLEPERATRLANATVDVCAYLETVGYPEPAGSGVVAYHPHCQARTVGAAGPAVETLERAGYTVRTSNAECCGMAGSFGYKRGTHDVAQAVGEGVAAQLEGADRIAASGASCRHHLETILEEPVSYPIELLDPQG